MTKHRHSDDDLKSIFTDHPSNKSLYLPALISIMQFELLAPKVLLEEFDEFDEFFPQEEVNILKNYADEQRENGDKELNFIY